MILSFINSAAPLILAALGGLLTELAGVLNIALEGMILTGAFTGILFTHWTGSPFAGALAGAASGLLSAWLFSFSSFRLKGNIFITGLGINILMPALIASFSQSLFGNQGIIRLESSKKIPVLLGFDTFTWLSLVIAAIMLLFLYRTYQGLALRASGERPELLQSRGISPDKTRSRAVLVSGILAGISGAALSLRLGAFVPGMSAGKGWIALVAIYLGYKKVPGIIAACLLFAGAEGIANRAQGTLQIPPTLILSFPYFFTLLGLGIFALVKKQKT